VNHGRYAIFLEHELLMFLIKNVTFLYWPQRTASHGRGSVIVHDNFTVIAMYFF
jgi:hypothetical protein